MRYEFSEKELYNQLLYFRGLWDVDKGAGVSGNETAIIGENSAENEERLKAVREWNRERFGTARGVVEGYLGKCGRVWVQMDGLFGFALKG